MTPPTIHRVTELDLTLRRQPWTFADRKRVEIDAHFSRNLAEKPKLWDGRILLARNPRFGGNRFSADYFETGFASFLAWRDWGFPDHEVFNGFGMGALRCADGAFVLGEMADHTANGGRIYFPAGTPDLDDIVGASVDIAGYSFRFEGTQPIAGPNYTAQRGRFTVTRNGAPVTTMQPEKRFYPLQRMPLTDAAIHTNGFADLYAVLSEEAGNDGAWVVRLYYNPLVPWIWFGAIIMALGGLVSLSDRRFRVGVPMRRAAPVASSARA